MRAVKCVYVSVDQKFSEVREGSCMYNLSFKIL